MNRKIVAFMLILAIVLGVVNTPQIIAGAKTTSNIKSIKIINPKKASLKLKVGSKFKLKIKIKPKAASKTKVKYSSSKKKVAAVSAKGVIKAKKEGKAKITVKAGKGKKTMKKDTIKVKVVKNDSGIISVSTPVPSVNTDTPPVFTATPEPALPDGTFTIASKKEAVQLFIDQYVNDYEGLRLVSECFAEDIKMVSDADLDIVVDNTKLKGSVIIAGSVDNNMLINKLVQEGKLNVDEIRGKWEVYKIDVVENPFDGVDKALVITGSDKRGTMYGLFSISELMGVSPWVYWADVNPVKKDEISFKYSEIRTVSKEPSVKYRGIFLNDEEPSLGTWVNNKFKTTSGGKFNENFYEHVFQLLLRLKANYMWPAMWNSSFGADGVAFPEASAELADTYGIVMGTSHHEPMMLAHQDWVRNKSKYGNGQWDWVTNQEGLTKFFTYGATDFGKYDNVCTIGMRGDGDATMLPEGSTVEENVTLLKEIITAQKNILNEKGLSDKPKMIALYKEVEEYWYGDDETEGLKEWDGLDDTIVLLAEDNYGNLRTLPTEENRNRAGGWGMYYHFDYNGAPASYQWTQTFQLQKVWEQMSMAYDYGVDDIWIVNVGDLKPMEMPISYFLDMAYDFDTWGTANIDSADEYENNWLKEQFGNYLTDEEINDVADLIDEYTRITTLRKPEIVKADTFSLENYNEAMRVLKSINDVKEAADIYKEKLPDEAQAAYYQLVYYPAVATTNVIKMQIYSGINKQYFKQGRVSANVYAGLLEESIEFDKELENIYSKNMPGGVGDKWDGMMAQATNARHVGYDSWKPEGKYPEAQYLNNLPDNPSMLVSVQGESKVHESGSIDLQEFTSINKEHYYIDIANAGKNPFNYEITTSADWIKVTDTNGTVNTQDTVGVEVDFDSLSDDATGTLTIKGNSQTVTVNIKANVIDVSGMDNMTYVEAHDYVSIEASHYSEKNAGGTNAEWKEINNYGRTLSSMKVFPTTTSFDGSDSAPYVEYKFYVDSSEKYSMQTQIAPSNNVDWNNVTMRFAYSVDNAPLKEVDTITSKYIAGTWRDSTWSNGVRDNIRTITESLGNLSEGVHTIKIYAVDPAIVLEKLIMYPSSKTLKKSYLGPEESYFVGKNVQSELIADIHEQ